MRQFSPDRTLRSTTQRFPVSRRRAIAAVGTVTPQFSTDRTGSTFQTPPDLPRTMAGKIQIRNRFPFAQSKMTLGHRSFPFRRQCGVCNSPICRTAMSFISSFNAMWTWTPSVRAVASALTQTADERRRRWKGRCPNSVRARANLA